MYRHFASGRSARAAIRGPLFQTTVSLKKSFQQLDVLGLLLEGEFWYVLIGVRDLPLRDMISLGAWRMGLGCSGKVLPSSPSPPPSPPPSPTRIWEMGTSRVLLRNRRFRSARIDPSSLPKHRRTNFKKSCGRKKQISKKS